MDFSPEDLSDAIDRLVAQFLERAGVAEPPVDALRLAEDHLGIPVEYAEPEEEDEYGRPRRARRPAGGTGLVLSPEMTDEQQQAAAAHAIARTLLPDLLRRLDITPGTESKQAAAHLRGLIAPRLLIPTRMLRSALRSCKYEVPALKGVFATAGFEAVALRLLDLDGPCVVAVVDDGVVAVRRGNREPTSRKLTPAEQACLDRVMELDEPQRVRADGWTAQGWPVPDRPFRRVVLRAVPDDI
jgi:predicted transcriptional regulator